MGNKSQKLLDRLLHFSVQIINLVKLLPKNSTGFTISSQIIRSSCSIGANCFETQDSVSRKEFLRGITIALKEARETLYWLNVIKLSKLITEDQLKDSIDECSQIVAILVSSIKTIKLKYAKK